MCEKSGVFSGQLEGFVHRGCMGCEIWCNTKKRATVPKIKINNPIVTLQKRVLIGHSFHRGLCVLGKERRGHIILTNTVHMTLYRPKWHGVKRLCVQDIRIGSSKHDIAFRQIIFQVSTFVPYQLVFLAVRHGERVRHRFAMQRRCAIYVWFV